MGRRKMGGALDESPFINESTSFPSRPPPAPLARFWQFPSKTGNAARAAPVNTSNFSTAAKPDGNSPIAPARRSSAARQRTHYPLPTAIRACTRADTLPLPASPRSRAAARTRARARRRREDRQHARPLPHPRVGTVLPLSPQRTLLRPGHETCAAALGLAPGQSAGAPPPPPAMPRDTAQPPRARPAEAARRLRRPRARPPAPTRKLRVSMCSPRPGLCIPVGLLQTPSLGRGARGPSQNGPRLSPSRKQETRVLGPDSATQCALPHHQHPYKRPSERRQDRRPS